MVWDITWPCACGSMHPHVCTCTVEARSPPQESSSIILHFVFEIQHLTEPGAHQVAILASQQALGILLLLPLQCWNYRCILLHLFPYKGSHFLDGAMFPASVACFFKNILLWKIPNHIKKQNNEPHAFINWGKLMSFYFHLNYRHCTPRLE